MREAFRDINRGNRARIIHQMLDLTRAPDGKQSPFFRVLRLGATGPQRVVNAVDFDDARVSQNIVVGARLSESLEQPAPAVRAWALSGDAI
jgi:hypothetical protein